MLFIHRPWEKLIDLEFIRIVNVCFSTNVFALPVKCNIEVKLIGDDRKNGFEEWIGRLDQFRAIYLSDFRKFKEVE